MITAEKAKELTKRAIFNNIDEQLRYVFEDIRDAALDGKAEFIVDNYRCTKESYSSYIWLLGPRSNSSDWQKVEKVIKNQGFNVKYYLIRQGEDYVSITW